MTIISFAPVNISKSEEFKKSLSRYLKNRDNMISFTDKKIGENITLIEEIKLEQNKLDKRLNFLLEDEDLGLAREFKAEYKEKRIKLRNKKSQLEAEIKKLEMLKFIASNDEPSSEFRNIKKIGKRQSRIKFQVYFWRLNNSPIR